MKYCKICPKRFECYTTEKHCAVVWNTYVNTAKGIKKAFAYPDANKKILVEIKQNGQYSHNIITLTLQGVAASCGYEAANSLIDECNLEDYGWEKENLPK